MRNMTAEQLTDVVLERYASTPDPRLREILTGLIRHLHDFARDVRLTEEEWIRGVLFLTATGQISDDKRQEMILLSDNLGLSSLVNLISEGVPEGATETTVLGPFYVEGTPLLALGESIAKRRKPDDETLVIQGHVRGVDGAVLPHAEIEVWQTDTNGMYDIQDPEAPENNLRGRYRADEDGYYRIDTIRPTAYPIPTDGPVGDLLRATARHPWRPAHVHAIVSKPGYRRLTTHLFDSEDKYLDSDVVFAVKENLIKEFRLNTSPEDAERLGVDSPFRELAHDFVLSPE